MIKNKYSFANMTVPFLWKNKVGTKEYPNQYHFNTFKLNTFLSNIAKSRGIKITNDEIKKVNTVKNKIKSLVGEKKKYSFDFYIDCTGFKRLLISSLGAKWISYSKYLCMNSAIAFPTKDTDEYNPYTLARAMSAGWMWRIPTFGRWGNGYIFNDKYITEAQAKKECEQYLGHSITIAKKIKFNPGRLDMSWINNCCALGLSSNFMEPMEASSIGTSIKQSFMLAEDILQYNNATINFYNKRLQTIVENIRDFIVLHYLCNKKDSVFWKDKPFEIPNTLQKYLDIWKVRLPNKNDFQENKLLFYQSNFILVLHGIGLISNKQLKYLFYQPNISEDINHLLFFYGTTPVVSHKNYLKQIRLKI
jgi:tryptophan halogenase